MSGPSTIVDLEWTGEQRFSVRSGAHSFVLDGNGQAAASPVDLLVAALAGCMAVDVAHILTKGREPLARLSAHLEAERAPQSPKRVTHVRLRFVASGALDPAKVERAIALSRDTYCSVWHSLKPDIAFETSFEVVP